MTPSAARIMLGAMSNKPDPRSRRVDLLPDDIVRLSRLTAHYRKAWGKSKFDRITEVEVMRAAWKDAAIALGIEAAPVDVEPRSAGVR